MKIKPTHGNKHVCTNCNAKYYDLGKEDATCPRCSHVRTVITKALARNKKKAESKTVASA